MKKKFVIYVLISLLSMSFVICLLPYPVFSNYTNITEQDARQINILQETELKATTSNETKILDIDWFSGIDSLVEVGKSFEVLDIESDQSFYVMRIGGTNHADIVPQNESDIQILNSIAPYSWQCRPVLVKINKSCYFPASLCLYPHGYNSNLNDDFNGHLCLHFKNSKTHGTNRIDEANQRCVRQSKQLGKSLI